MSQPRSISDLPGPSGWPLVGNALQIDPMRTYQILKEWAVRYGASYRFTIGKKAVVAISDVEEINDILCQRPHRYRRWRRLEELGLEIGADGVFIAEQERWRQHRKLVTYALSRRNITPFFDRLRLVTERLLHHWVSSAERQQPHDVTRSIAAYTTDIVSGLAFGEDLNTLEGHEDQLQAHLKTVFRIIAKRQASPIAYWRFIRLRADREADDALEEIRRVIGTLIERARRNLELFPERLDHPTNMIESLIAAQQRGGAESLSDEEIMGNVMTLLLAGEDTTANTIAWAVHFLTLYPDVQSRLREEAIGALGDRVLPDAPEMLDDMPYLEAVAFETMRLKPVFPIIFVEPLEDAVVAGVSIPAGTPLALLTGQMGEQPDCFSKPNEFRPERWLSPPALDLPLHDLRGHLPFGSGARLCPGKYLAMLEMKMALATLARNFVISNVSSAPPVEELFALTLAPTAVMVQLQRTGARLVFPETLNDV